MLKIKLRSDEEQRLSVYFAREELRAEADRDLARRSLVGVFSYVLIWLIIYLRTELDEVNAALLELLGFLLLASAVGRLYLAFNFSRLYAENQQRWRWLFSAGTILAAAIWGGVCALALNYDGIGTTSVLVMLSTAGIAAGGMVALAPSPWIGGIYVLALLFPTAHFALLSGNVPERSVALLFLTFFVFMFFLWRRLHVEYWSALAGRAKLEQAKKVAEAATLAKGQFIASVSHELRTPLTAVIGALGMIDSYPSEEVPAETKTLIDMAYRNGKRLSHLIDDLLDFEKLSANRMTFHCKPVSLTHFLIQALELNQPYAENYRVNFVLDRPDLELEVVADEQRLMQVMTNLLSNAAKHSPADKQVLISVKQREGMGRVEVTDSGAGVPDHFRQQIFENFSQAKDSSARNIKGTGLGLAISKAIIDQMGGKIGFESVVGQGSTFYFELPMAEKS